ncbi:hypothetical protein [Catenovulum adriaticum]|uniref:XRE family transcriptional regulator n=1 Tax=Catenovulum adriaticum TaxID=2984846 RepID=A0ABY7AN23_9ALTE|nr:hypothetical protein [Catenovulum sp. TS8]WAJ69739.1 hypothetical protein OLW01_11320 [Catenovulum sp. TS8]
MDYLDMYAGSTSIAPSEIVMYADVDSRCLPISIVTDEEEYSLYETFGSNSSSIVLKRSCLTQSFTTASEDSTFSVDDCVKKCQEILGLKINEIAKLVGVSRASLDLHRKGANLKSLTNYEEAYNFVLKVEAKFGNAAKFGLRNILIERKTLVQHLIKNKDNLEAVTPYIEYAVEKSSKIKIDKTQIDNSKSKIRLSGIGRLA